MKSVKSFALAAIVAVAAIGAAYATAPTTAKNSFAFPAGAGYTTLVQIPSQGAPCVYRKDCLGGDFACKIQIGTPVYNLFGNPTGTVPPCDTQLGQPNP